MTELSLDRVMTISPRLYKRHPVIWSSSVIVTDYMFRFQCWVGFNESLQGMQVSNIARDGDKLDWESIIGTWNESHIVAVPCTPRVHIGHALLAQFFIVVFKNWQESHDTRGADLRHDCVTCTGLCWHCEIEVSYTTMRLFVLDVLIESTHFLVGEQSLSDVSHSHSVWHCVAVWCVFPHRFCHAST